MSKIIKKIEDLKKKTGGYWGERVISELQYASNLSGVNEDKYEEEISKALEYLLGELNEKGVLTGEAVTKPKR